MHFSSFMGKRPAIHDYNLMETLIGADTFQCSIFLEDDDLSFKYFGIGNDLKEVQSCRLIKLR